MMMGSPDDERTGLSRDLAVKRATLMVQIMLADRRADEAQAAAAALLALAPDQAQARWLAAEAAFLAGDFVAAIDHGRLACDLDPTVSEYWGSFGAALQRYGHPDAEPVLRRALELDPDNVSALTNLGILAYRADRFDEALDLQRRAAQWAGDDPVVLLNLSNALIAVGEAGEAEARVRAGLARTPANADLLANIGIALRFLGRLDDSAEAHRRAIALRPTDAALHWNLAVTLLTAGDYAQALPHYERRWDDNTTFAAPRWRGEVLDGRRILLHQEQGLGDAIQFLRFVPQVMARGGRPSLLCDASLAPLFRDLPWFEAVVSSADDLPEHDVQASLMSLPALCGATIDNLPPPAYLTIAADRVADWRIRTRADGRLRVGLVWAGNPKHKGDRFRSLPLAQLAPLLGLDGVQFVSLQKGPASGQLADFPGVVDAGAAVGNFADTAAVLAGLDLLISCDSSPAHLAGALGVPFWLLLPQVPDWRWMMDRGDSPWYPAARLYRQDRLGDWTPVVVRLQADLARWATGGTA